MPKPNAWWKRSRACRVELRASRQLAAALVAVGVLGVVSWFLSDAPRLLAVFASAAGLLLAVRLAAREARRATMLIDLQSDGRASIDGAEVRDLEVEWRGAWMSLTWRRGGRVERRTAFPDALDPAARRELRLWSLSRREHPVPPAVAP